jgi:hypothetical protein
MTTRALSSSGVQVLGQDCSEIIKRVAKRMLERDEAARLRQRELDAEYAYEGRDSFVCIVRRVSESPLLYVASTVTELPRGGSISTSPQPDRFLEAEFRMALARAFWKAGMEPTFEEARQRASKAKVYLERSMAHGTKVGA